MVALGEDIETRASAGDVAAQLELAHRLDAEGKSEESLGMLRRAALSEDLAARTALSRQLLKEPKRFEEEFEGRTRAVVAANDGSGEAAYLVAAMAAEGYAMAQNWTTALTYLQRAAELGFGQARRELIFLSGDKEAAVRATEGGVSAADIWQKLRRGIDLKAQLALPPQRVVNIDPRIAIVERFLTPEACDWLVERARTAIRPATTIDPATGEPHFEDGRTNSSTKFRFMDLDFPIFVIRHRIAELTRLPLFALESPAVLHYAAGQEYTPHYDFYDPNEPGYAKKIETDGQRVATFLVYLNDDYDGAETDFPLIPWRHKGRKGDAVHWWNVLPAGAPDRKTLHAGLPPSRGEKWLFSQWITPLPRR